MSDSSQLREESTFTYEVSANESLCEAVVHAVSTVAGVAAAPSASLDTGSDQVLQPLHTVIDPDALESVFTHAPSRSTQPRARITFSYNGHEVTVSGMGRITVEPHEARTTEAAN